MFPPKNQGSTAPVHHGCQNPRGSRGTSSEAVAEHLTGKVLSGWSSKVRYQRSLLKGALTGVAAKFLGSTRAYFDPFKSAFSNF